MNADPDGPRGRGGRGAGPGFCGGPGGRGPARGRYRRSVLEVAILSSLAESRSHGYNLVDQIEALTGDLICVDAGSMYRLLRAMEGEELVSSSWQTPEAGPSRRVYVITEQGLEALALMARALSRRAEAMQSLADHATQAIKEAGVSAAD